MKITLNKRISAIVVLIFIMMAPMTQGMRPIALGENPERTEIMPSSTISRGTVLLAQNKGNTAEDKAQGSAGSKEQVSEPESGPGADSNDSSTKSKTAPLKTFKPSEEIAAEQAVDFPVDI